MTWIDFNNGTAVRARPMAAECDDIARDVSLKLEVDNRSRPGRAYLRFSNRSALPIWFPDEPEPAFQPDEKEKRLKIWFGYFDEIYGQYRGRYMLPQMRLVRPGQDIEIELISPALVGRLAEGRLVPEFLARVATKPLIGSNTRGEQPLEDYLQHSCTIQS